VIGQLPGEWFDDLEYFRDFAFVVGQHDAFRQHIGNDKKPFQQHVPQLNRSAGLNLILGSTGKCDDRGFFLKTLKLAADPGLQPFQKTGFIFRRKADQHRDAIAEKNGDAGLANPDRERDRGKSFILEAHGIDAVAKMQGVRGDPCPDFGRNEFGFGHPAVSPSLQASKDSLSLRQAAAKQATCRRRDADAGSIEEMGVLECADIYAPPTKPADKLSAGDLARIPAGRRKRRIRPGQSCPLPKSIRQLHRSIRRIGR
jgi:hypothetical protein